MENNCPANWQRECDERMIHGEKNFAEFARNHNFIIEDILVLLPCILSALKRAKITDLRQLILMSEKEIANLWPLNDRLSYILAKRLRCVGLDLGLKDIPDFLR